LAKRSIKNLDLEESLLLIKFGKYGVLAKHLHYQPQYLLKLQ